MENWAGFTDADLRKLKHQGPTKDGISPRLQAKKPGPSCLVVQKRPIQGQRKQPPRQSQGQTALAVNTLTPEQRLSQPNKTEKITEPEPPQACDTSQTGPGKVNNTTSTDTGSHRHSQEGSTDNSPEHDGKAEDADNDMVTDDQEIFKHEAHNMESFQKQQKMIEELNKKKKQMLHSAIKERAKAAKAESAKLTEIGSELAKLDQLLTVDVSIIRDKIETSCREFFDAQKRYDRAEKEYIDSKIDLHNKMDAKEQLTEHLYTVIYQNEMRKSKKLAELMTKLEMETGENIEIPECEMPHPSLLSPVQLPAGRYGQIGLLSTKSPPTSPESAPDVAEATLTPTDVADQECEKVEGQKPAGKDCDKTAESDTKSSDQPKDSETTETPDSTIQAEETVSSNDSKESSKSLPTDSIDINENMTGAAKSSSGET